MAIDFQAVKDLAAQRDAARFSAPAATRPQSAAPAATPFVPKQIIAPKPAPFVLPNLRNARTDTTQKTAPFNLATVPLTPMGMPTTERDLAGLPSGRQNEQPQGRVAAGLESVVKGIGGGGMSLASTVGAAVHNNTQWLNNDRLVALDQERSRIESQMSYLADEAMAQGMEPKDLPAWMALYNRQQEIENEWGDEMQNVPQASVDPNSWSQTTLRESQAARGRATEGLTGAPRFLADSAISIAQNAPFIAASAVTGNPAIALAGGAAVAGGAETFNRNEQGYSPSESALYGATKGAIEAITEKVPLDNLLNIVQSGGGRSLVRSILQQSGIEATEEAVSYGLGYLADVAFGDEDAEFSLRELGESAAGGALSGLVFGAGGVAGNAISNQMGNSGVANSSETAYNNDAMNNGGAINGTGESAANISATNIPAADGTGLHPAGEQARVSRPAFAGDNQVGAGTELSGQRNYTGAGVLSHQTQEAMRSVGRAPIPLSDSTAHPQDFHSALAAAIEANPNGAMVDLHSVEDYANMRTFMTPDGMAGVAVEPSGNIVSVFRNPNSGQRGAASTLIPAALENGGNRLDNYDGELSLIYEQFGFIPVARVAFDPTYTPDGWERITSPNKTPDIVFWAHNGEAATEVVHRQGSYATNDMSQVPMFDSYDEAMAYRDQMLAERQPLSHAEGGDSVGATRVGNTDSVNADYYEALENSGQMPFGENPHRQVLLPNQDIEGNNISRSARTVLEAQATPSEAVDAIGTAAVQGELSYLPVTNDNTSERARNRLRNNGFTKSLGAWETAVESGTVSADLMAMGAHLYNNAVNSGDMKTAVEILVNYQSLNTNAAQALQAARILKTLSPENKLYALDATVRRIVDSVNNSSRYQERGVHVKVDPALTQEYAQAQDDAGRDAALNKIYENIASQIPSTFSDRWNAWRYLAMLGNPRTHIRNIIGNVGFVPMRQTRNAISAGAENVMSRFLPNMERTRSVLNPLDGADRALWDAARSDAANVQSELLGEGKYQERFGAIENARTIFNNRVLEAARRGNSNLLELEDALFSQMAYADALGGYLKANGIDAQAFADGTVKPELLDRARAFAIKEAQEATYRDSNAFSDFVSKKSEKLKRSDNAIAKGANFLIEGVIPFKKTPANLIARGVEYSPIGLMKGIYDSFTQVSNGNMTANQVIDEISAGLTGTGVLALGVFLRSMGILVGGGTGDKEQDEMNRLQGVQNYALQIGDTSYTLDWLAPASMPLYVGVALYDAVSGADDDVSLGKIFDAAMGLTEPMLEMSMLQSLEDIISGVSYEEQKIPYLLGTAAVSHITQAVPTFLGQIARTMDGGDRRNFIQGDSDMPRFLETAVQRTGRRIPFLSANYEKYVDAWGRTTPEQHWGTRAILNTLSPGFLSTITTTAADEEIQRLYDSIGATLTPSSLAKSYKLGDQTYYLTAPEFSRFSITKGQTSLEAVEALMRTDYYQGLPDDEKAKTIERAYELATYIAKREFFESRNIEYSNSTWDKSLPALEAGVSPAALIEYRGMLTDTTTATKTNVWAQAQGDSSLNAAQREALNDTINFQSDKFLGAWPEVQALGLSADDYAQAWQINGMNSEELGALVLEAGLAREQVVRNLVAAKNAAELKRKLLLDMGMDRVTVNRLLRLI